MSIQVMTGHAVFRAGLNLPEHRQLFDYWASLNHNGCSPCRTAFNPSAVARLLPSLLLIDVADPIADSTVRLAGTRIVDMHQGEITGSKISALDWGGPADYWLSGLETTAAENLPSSGAYSFKGRSGYSAVRYWLRLPLRNRSDDVKIVLCHDVMASEATLRRIVTI
jgi:hypothetical protein